MLVSRTRLEDRSRTSLGSPDYLSIFGNGLRANVQTEPTIIDTLLVGSNGSLSIFSEFVSTYVISRQVNLNTFFSSFFHNVWDCLGSLFVEQRRTNLSTIENLIEGESHTTTNDHFIDDIEHVVDKLNLILDLGTSHDDSKGSLRAIENLGEILELLLQKETSGLGLDVNSDHRGVSSVCSTECIINIDVTIAGDLLSESSDFLSSCLNFLTVDLAFSRFGSVESHVLE